MSRLQWPDSPNSPSDIPGTIQPRGQPVDVHVHDFLHLGQGKAVPYGPPMTLLRNRSALNVGISDDTVEFAIEVFVAGGAWTGAGCTTTAPARLGLRVKGRDLGPARSETLRLKPLVTEPASTSKFWSRRFTTFCSTAIS